MYLYFTYSALSTHSQYLQLDSHVCIVYTVYCMYTEIEMNSQPFGAYMIDSVTIAQCIRNATTKVNRKKKQPKVLIEIKQRP